MKFNYSLNWSIKSETLLNILQYYSQKYVDLTCSVGNHFKLYCYKMFYKIGFVLNMFSQGHKGILFPIFMMSLINDFKI